jgi:hypothetical protein
LDWGVQALAEATSSEKAYADNILIALEETLGMSGRWPGELYYLGRFLCSI